jgi:hypothetical protein
MKRFSVLMAVAFGLSFTTAAFSAEIGGNVADQQGTPAPSITISAADSSGKTVGSGITDAKGAYSITNIAPGDYKLSLKPGGANYRGETVVTHVGADGLTVDWKVSQNAPAIALAKEGIQSAGIDPFGLSLGEFASAVVLGTGVVAGGVVGGYGAAGGFSASSSRPASPNL